MSLIKDSQRMVDLATQSKIEIATLMEKGTKAAAKRARKNLMEMKKLAHSMRVEVMDELKTL